VVAKTENLMSFEARREKRGGGEGGICFKFLVLRAGRQDAMQRQSLVPLRAFMQSKLSSDGAGLKLLEVACGTGRFATFVKVCSTDPKGTRWNRGCGTNRC